MRALFDSVERLQSAITFHRERHTILAGNIANVDTPGYKPLDLERTTAPPPGDATALAVTNEAHLQPGQMAGAQEVIEDAGDLVSADGNAVNLERELAKIDANRVRFNATTELVSRRLALLRYAAGDGQL